jgi:periplasmic protein TonB
MFEDSLLERRFGNTHRGRATLISLALQLVLVGVLILIPLLFVEALPNREMVTLLVAPPPPPPPPPAAAVKVVKIPIHSEILDNGQLRAPARIPDKIAMIKESTPPPPTSGGVVGGVPGGIPGGVLGGVVGGILHSIPSPHLPNPAPKPVQPQRIRVSQGITEGLLIHQVKPQYPPLAREARIQGPVVLKAIIARDGSIKDLQLVSGNPLLVPSTIAAVKDWRYRPYLLNGQPVEVETHITVNFNLG